MNSKVQFRIFTIVDLDKEEEYLHEMHLKGWRYRTSCFGLFYFEECQPGDVLYRVFDKKLGKKYHHQLGNLKDGDWELVETGSSLVFRKAVSDLLPDDEVFCKDLKFRWVMVNLRLRASIAALLGGFLACLLLYRESLSQSFFVIFMLYVLMFSYLIYGYFRLKRKYRVDER